MNPFTLQGKTILITGASSGIGACTARLCADMGATLVLSARSEQKLADVKDTLSGEEHRIIQADVTKEDQLRHLVEQLPALDGLVHSAGMVKAFPVKFIGEKQIEQLFALNYKGPIKLNSFLLKAKKINNGGAVVFMSSISSFFAHKGGALYAGSKAALNAYSKALALEYAEKKIRSNVIAAAMVKTPLFDRAEQAVSKEMMDKHGDMYPLGFGEPEDIAHAIVFLLSDASRWITGTELIMDGGLSAGH